MKAFSKYFLLVVGLIATFSACEKTVSVSGPKVYKIGSSQYYISTEPQGAEIFVDDKNTGQITPDTLKWLTEGTHSFTLKLDPYVDHSFAEEFDFEDIKSNSYSFIKDPINLGGIKFYSTPPGAEIYLDDSLLANTTPYVIENLLPKEYKVKFTYPEYWSDSLIVFVRPSKEAYANRTLIDSSVYVNYQTKNSFLPDNSIKDIYIDGDEIWVATWHNGIAVSRNGKWDYINETNSILPSNTIHKIKKDNDNNIWIATSKGLAKINGNLISAFDINNSGLPNNYVTDVDFDLDGNIWIGTQKGITKFDGNSNWKTYNSSNSGLPANFITSVLVDGTDYIWLGSNNFNTFRFNKIDQWVVYQSDNSLIGDTVNDLILDQNNNLWVGLASALMKGKYGGAYMLEENRLKQVTLNVSDKYVNSFYLDDLNSMWIGTRAGVIVITETGNSKLINSSNSGIPINDISCISKDKYGNMWFGTNGAGLVKYKLWKE